MKQILNLLHLQARNQRILSIEEISKGNIFKNFEINLLVTT